MGSHCCFVRTPTQLLQVVVDKSLLVSTKSWLPYQMVDCSVKITDGFRAISKPVAIATILAQCSDSRNVET